MSGVRNSRPRWSPHDVTLTTPGLVGMESNNHTVSKVRSSPSVFFLSSMGVGGGVGVNHGSRISSPQ